MPTIEELEKMILQLKKEKEVSNKKQVSKQNKNKKTNKKQSKKEEKPRPKLPYSEVSNILKEMKLDELKSRFGIIYNTENPYNISGKAIEKFYLDYNIDKRFKLWHMSYDNKNLINDRQLENQPKEIKVTNITNRINELDKKINDKHKGKSVNQKDKITEFLINQIEKLELQLEKFK